MKKVILILVTICSFLCACNKTEQALIKIYGTYTIKTYTVDDADSLSLYLDKLGPKFHFYFLMKLQIIKFVLSVKDQVIMGIQVR